MFKRSLLLITAASAAPLLAQQPRLPEPAVQVFSALAAPTAAAQASAEERAAVFSALALLPQDVSSAYVLCDVGGNIQRLAKHSILLDLRTDEVPAELLAIDNIAFAASAASPATCAFLAALMDKIRTRDAVESMAGAWKNEARAELADTIVQALTEGAMAAAGQLSMSEQALGMPVGYAVVTTKPGAEQALQALYAIALAHLEQAQQPWISRVENENGFCGIRLDLGKKHEQNLAEGIVVDSPEEQVFAAEMARHKVCILLRIQGNALILAVCEDPQQVQLADTPAQSVLATELMADCDSRLNKGLVMAAHLSPEMEALSQGSANISHLAEGMRAVFRKLAEVDAAHKESYDKAGAAVEPLSHALQALSSASSHPTDVQVWSDGNLHLAATADARGSSYRPGVLRLAALADAPKTAFYAECTPVQRGFSLPGKAALPAAALALAEGVALTLHENRGKQLREGLAAAATIKPELKGIASAALAIGRGLDGQLALVLDSAHGPLPPIAEAPHAPEADIPRLALYAGVSNRSQLLSGWESMKAATRAAAAKLGHNTGAFGMLPLVPTHEGQTTRYQLALPIFTMDTAPSLALSDTGLAVGSSANLTRQMLTSATGTIDFAGAVFAFRLTPLARSLRSLATALDTTPEEAEPAADSKVRLEHGDKGIPSEVLNSEEGPVVAHVSTRLAGQQRLADRLSHAAAILEQASAVARSVYGTSTVEGDKHRIRIDVQLK